MTTREVPVGAAAAVVVCCAWFGVFGMVEGQHDARLWADLDRRGVSVTARVVDEGYTSYTVGTAQVQVPDSTLVFTDQGGTSRRVDVDVPLQAGSTVGIIYDPLDPSRVRTADAAFPVRQAIGKVLVVVALVLAVPLLVVVLTMSRSGRTTQDSTPGSPT